MGISFGQRAGWRLDAWMGLCIEQTGRQTSYKLGNDEYFLQPSNKEHGDGAITGSIHKCLPNDMCRQSGNFRIEGNGRVTRAPSVFKNVPLYIARINGSDWSPWLDQNKKALPLTQEQLLDWIKTFTDVNNRDNGYAIHRVDIINADNDEVVLKWHASNAQINRQQPDAMPRREW